MALKLKGISYIHAEGYPAGEMKHGPNALIDDELLVVFVATYEPGNAVSELRYQKTLSNMEEVKARQGIVVGLINEGDHEAHERCDAAIELPPTSDPLLRLVSVTPFAVSRVSHRRDPRLRPRSTPQPGQVRHRRVAR